MKNRSITNQDRIIGVMAFGHPLCLHSNVLNDYQLIKDIIAGIGFILDFEVYIGHQAIMEPGSMSFREFMLSMQLYKMRGFLYSLYSN